jgi:hypothetical protein
MALRFDRVNELSLVDTVGCRAPLLEAIYAAMREELYSDQPGRVSNPPSFA